MSQFLVGGFSDKKIIVWEAESGCELTSIMETAEISNLNCNVDGSLILVGSKKSSISIWESSSGILSKTFLADATRSCIISLVNFNLDSSRIVTVTEGGIFQIWDVESGNLLHRWGGTFCSGQKSARFSTSSDNIISVSKFCEYTVWDIERGVPTVHVAAPKQTKACVIPAGNSTLIAYRDKVGALTVRNLATNSLCFTVPDEAISGMKFDSAGERLLSVSASGLAKIRDANSGSLICSFQDDRIVKACFNADGSRAATIGGDSCLRVWDAVTGTVIYTKDLPNVLALTFCGESLEYLLK